MVQRSRVRTRRTPRPARDTQVTHEDCDVTSETVEKIDANGDGKPDITIVREGGRELCRAVDLNFDGVIDAYSYFDASGQLRRRENDYDKDGQIDEITTFKGGQIARRINPRRSLGTSTLGTSTKPASWCAPSEIRTATA